jgi:hypothetical protein
LRARFVKIGAEKWLYPLNGNDLGIVRQATAALGLKP